MRRSGINSHTRYPVVKCPLGHVNALPHNHYQAPPDNDAIPSRWRISDSRRCAECGYQFSYTEKDLIVSRVTRETGGSMKKILLLVLVSSLTCWSHAQAGFHSATDLLHACDAAVKAMDYNSSESPGFQTYCIGYMAGVVDTVRVWRLTSGKSPAPDICLPDHFDVSNAARLVVTHLRNHSDQEKWTPIEVSLAALHGSYPCPAEH
jgi:hypothetical protein